MFVQSAIVPPPLSAFAGPVFIPAWPLESAATFGPAPITAPKARLGNAPLLILSPGHRRQALLKDVATWGASRSKEAYSLRAELARVTAICLRGGF